MRTIESLQIVKAVRQLCFDAAYNLPDDVLAKLEHALTIEESPLGQSIIQQCIDNAKIAKDTQAPICQDTGFAVLFIELGQDLIISGDTLTDACNEGVRQGYKDAYLRKSIVNDPLYSRVNTKDNTPAVIHIDIVKGDKLKIMLAPKGGGAENMSKVAMLKPSDGEQGVIDFVVNSVINSKGNPCPPTIVGVGIGGTFEKCAEISKRALLRPLGTPNKDARYTELEQKILTQINNSGVGPQGLGGRVTALAVHIETHPCHIAQMPVAINLSCHAARHAEVEL